MLSINEAIRGDFRIISWLGLSVADAVGAAFLSGDFQDKSVQVIGTFGAGGTVLIEGTNEATPVNWSTLSDPAGVALSFTSAGIKAVLENTRWIRPKVSAGDGTTDIDVMMMIAGR